MSIRCPICNFVNRNKPAWKVFKALRAKEESSMHTSNLKHAFGLAAVLATLTAGSAFAAVTTDNAVNVMAGPSSNTKIIAKLDADASVNITSTRSSWCKINASGTVGWVPCADLNGATPKKVTSAAAGPSWKGYDFSTDPILGVDGQASPHQQGDGQFF
jgi:uncharacterized protein YgiM (DUF1202 family)